jgi:hypothetical protein
MVNERFFALGKTIESRYGRLMEYIVCLDTNFIQTPQCKEGMRSFLETPGVVIMTDSFFRR